MTARILIVEDDELLCRGVSFALEREGYEVVAAGGYEGGYSAFLNGRPDLALIDINLPDKNGDALCARIRKTSGIPVIFITANDTEEDVINGFRLGCDDYIAKPFSVEVLKQRVGAVLRRAGKTECGDVFTAGEIEVDFGRFSAKKAGLPVKLTVTEYRLLELLVKNRGQVLTRRALLEKLWDADGNYVDENALSVNILRLRRKLEDDPGNPRLIVTIFGIGYTWGSTT